MPQFTRGLIITHVTHVITRVTRVVSTTLVVVTSLQCRHSARTGRRPCHDDDEVMLNVLGCRLTY